MKYRFVPLLLMLLAGCELDDFLYNTKPLSTYTLSTGIIPASARTEVQLSSENVILYGYLVRSPDSTAKTILYCHGNRDNIEFYWDRAELLYRAGFHVFIFDYRGFGRSGGSSSEQSLYADGRTALGYLRNELRIADTNIIVYGFSLGGVPAVDLASRVFTPRALVCEAIFASGETLVQSGTLLDIPGSYLLAGEYDNANRMKMVKAPALVLHGEEDSFIDIDKNGAVVYSNANEPKQFVRIPKANHDNIPATMGEEKYIDLLREFAGR